MVPSSQSLKVPKGKDTQPGAELSSEKTETEVRRGYSASELHMRGSVTRTTRVPGGAHTSRADQSGQ